MDSGDVQHKRKRPTDGLPAKRASEPNIHPIEQHFSVDGARSFPIFLQENRETSSLTPILRATGLARPQAGKRTKLKEQRGNKQCGLNP
jgi:hypothetical protein